MDTAAKNHSAHQRHSAAEAALKRHDAEIAGIRGDVAEIRKGQDSLRGAVSDLSAAMADIRAFIHRAESVKPVPPIDAIKSYLQIAQSAGVLIAFAVACIVYVSSTGNNGELYRIKDRLERMEQSFEWQAVPKQRQRTPTAMAPTQ